MTILHDLPREAFHAQILRRLRAAEVERDELRAEVAQRTAFALELAERLFLAAEVLGRLAERRGTK